jgi:hypothetical protein
LLSQNKYFIKKRGAKKVDMKRKDFIKKLRTIIIHLFDVDNKQAIQTILGDSRL